MFSAILIILGGLIFAIAVTRTTALRLVIVACVLVLAAASAPKRSSPGPAADAVHRFFAAIDAGDCAAAMDELSREYRAKLDRADVGCGEFVVEMSAFPLEAVVTTTVDGRDREVRLVRVRLGGREHDVIVRVRRQDYRWKIVSI